MCDDQEIESRSRLYILISTFLALWVLLHLPVSRGGVLRFPSYFAPLGCQCSGCRAVHAAALGLLLYCGHKTVIGGSSSLGPNPAFQPHPHSTWPATPACPFFPQLLGLSVSADRSPPPVLLTSPYPTRSFQVSSDVADTNPRLVPLCPGREASSWTRERPHRRLSFGGRKTVEVS